MKLTVKQPLIMLLTIGIIGVISGSVLIYFQIRSNNVYQQHALDDMSSILINHIHHDMLHGSPQTLEESISGLKGLAGITEIALYDAKGYIFASNQPGDVSQRLDEAVVSRVIGNGYVDRHIKSLNSGREFGAIYPVFNKPECQRCHGAEKPVLGGLEIGVDAEPYFKAVQQQVFLIIITGIIAFGVVAGISMVSTRRIVLNRLKRLEHSAEHVASGDYSHRIVDGSQDEIGAVAGAFNDMAEKVQNSIVQLNETVVKRTEERSTLESIMSGMGEGLVVVDNQGNLTYLNTAAEKLLGIKATELLGQPIEIFCHAVSTRVLEPKNWEDILCSAFKQPGEHAKLLFILQLPKRHEIEADFFTVGGPDQRSGIGAILRDITKEREVDRMKTEFISVASHELRTPMTVVYGFAELLLTSKVTLEEQRQWLERIYKESQRLTNIVDDLLNVSRIESGRLSLKLEAISIQPVVSQVIEQFNTTRKSHVFRMDIPENFPRLWADTDRLTQVLYNLLDNAVKYSPKGGPVIISAHMEKDNNQAILAVADKGLGIPPEEIPKLFTRFHRIHRPETEGIRGTGLGLSIVKSLVEMMEGKVWVESVVNQGSTFYIALPLAVS